MRPWFGPFLDDLGPAAACWLALTAALILGFLFKWAKMILAIPIVLPPKDRRQGRSGRMAVAIQPPKR
jgi:hypothetical protein